MHILEYCESTGEPVARLAKRMGLDRSHLNKIALGQRDASADLLRRLFEATNGKITPTDQIFAPKAQPGRQRRKINTLASCAPAKVARTAKTQRQTNVSGKTGQSLPSKASGPAKARQMVDRPKPKVRPSRPNNTG
jgi:transcriptional regulator with XRE-family HTH domain